MRPLNRPMFRYGGPIKEGVMSGIREPKKNGGKMLLVGQHPKEFRDASGREQHWLPLLTYGAAALRALPTVYRGFKTAKTFAPGTLTWGQRLKDIAFGSGRFRQGQIPSQGNMLTKAQIKAGMKPTMGKKGIWQSLKNPTQLGAAIREYPVTALSALTLPNMAAQAVVPVAKGIGGIGRAYLDALLPGDQSQWFKKKKEPVVTGVDGSPVLLNQKKKPTNTVTGPIKTAKEKREEQIQKYRDIMDIKSMNKDAAYDSLIAASKLVTESPDIKQDLKSGNLMNQIIQSTSKAFDKPKKTKDAIDTLILKGEIEKDIKASDPSNEILNRLREVQIKKGLKELNTPFAEAKIASSKNLSGQTAIDTAASVSSDNFKGNLITNTQLTDVIEKAKKAGDISEQDIIIQATTEVIKDKKLPDGDYTVGDVLVTIEEGQVVDLKR